MSNVEEIAGSRPAADHALEQFLMPSWDLEAQARRVGRFLEDRRVFFLGDDDHLSPILAEAYGVMPVVYEYDERIRTSLWRWFGRLGIRQFEIKPYDARQPVTVEPRCEAFYINPPYSSRSKGLGIKTWLMRALEACVPDCSGVLVMPREGGGIDEDWVDEVARSVDDFIAANGLSILAVEPNVSSYADTTQSKLRSSNVYLTRTDSAKVAAIDPAVLYN